MISVSQIQNNTADHKGAREAIENGGILMRDTFFYRIYQYFLLWVTCPIGYNV